MKHHKNRKEQLLADYHDFRLKHPAFWHAYVAEMDHRIATTHNIISSLDILIELRNRRRVRGGDGVQEFKINNNYAPYFARDYLRLRPENEHRIRTRKLFSEGYLPQGADYTPEDIQPDLGFESELQAIKENKK